VGCLEGVFTAAPLVVIVTKYETRRKTQAAFKFKQKTPKNQSHKVSSACHEKFIESHVHNHSNALLTHSLSPQIHNLESSHTSRSFSFLKLLKRVKKSQTKKTSTIYSKRRRKKLTNADTRSMRTPHTPNSRRKNSWTDYTKEIGLPIKLSDTTEFKH
jgi:hypothetical protein